MKIISRILAVPVLLVVAALRIVAMVTGLVLVIIEGGISGWTRSRMSPESARNLVRGILIAFGAICILAGFADAGLGALILGALCFCIAFLNIVADKLQDALVNLWLFITEG